MTDTIATFLDLPKLKVLEVELIGDEVHIHVESSTQSGTRCRCCGRQLTNPCGHSRERVPRRLPVFGRSTFIHIQPLRFECAHCRERPTTTQRVSWYDPRSPHTRAYDDYLLLQLRNSTVADVQLKEGVGYEAIMGGWSAGSPSEWTGNASSICRW
jgi:transposase